MSTTALVLRTHNGCPISHRRTDRFIDASGMCKAYGRRWRDYYRTAQAQAFLAALQKRQDQLGQNPASLVETREGHGGYVFVHPQVAIHLAQWLDAEFAVLVTEWMEELLTTGAVRLPGGRPQSLAVYTRRAMEIWRSADTVPEGHWAVFAEAAPLLLDVETACHAAGLVMHEFDLLDGSIGKHWPKYREGKPWEAGPRLRYLHRFPAGDPRGERMAWAYPDPEMHHFRHWLRKAYVPSHLGDYLRRKYGGAELVRSLPAFVSRGLGVKLPLSLR